MNPTKDPVYDKDDQKPVTRPDLRRREEGAQSGSSASTNFKFNPHGDNKKADGISASSEGDSGFRFSPKNDDAGGRTGTAGLLAKEVSAGGITGAAATFAGGAKNFFLGGKNRKRTIIGGGFTATLVGGGILILTMASGPAELVHLSQLLQHNFSISESDSESRTNTLLRSWKAYKEDDYRYTRVGLIGQKVMAKVVGQFEDAGVKFTGSDVLGRPTKIEVDRSTVEKNFPDTKGMSDAEFNDFLKGKFSVDSSLNFEATETGKTYSLDIEGLKARSINGFINKTSTKLLGNSKVVAAVKTRDLKKFFGLNSLFHPFSRATRDKISARVAEIKRNNPQESEGAAQEQAASEVEDSEFSSNTDALQEKGVKEGYEPAKNADDSFSQKVGSKLLPGLGALWAGGCTLNGLSSAIVSMNRYLVVMPSAVEATSLVSAGSGIENGGSDLTADQVSAIVKGLSGKQGQDIFSGAALRALEDPSKTSTLPRNSQGQIENDLPGEYKQAFGENSTSDTLKSVSNIMLSWFPLHYVSGVVPGGQCGLIAGSSIIVAGVFAQVASAIANAPDGEAGNIALQGAIQAGEDTGAGYVQGELLGPVINTIIDKIARAASAPKLVRSSFSGTLGGNLIAYGGRAAANSAAILNGGLSLGNNASTLIGSAGQEEQQQFRSESFFARMFDINDYRSLAGHLADEISPGVSANLQLGINNIFNIGSSLASVFGSLIPHTAADDPGSWTGDYNWEFPQYGIPERMLKDPAFSDTNQNLESVGKYFSTVCDDGSGNIGPSYGACSGSNGYTARILACFGNDLTYSDDSDIGAKVWDVNHAATAADSDVNPVSDTYQNANCADICPHTIADCGSSGEEQWEKIVMFVNDANNIKGSDCLAGYTDTSAQSCAAVGFSGSASADATASGTSTTPATTAGATIDMDHLYDSSVDVACASGTKDLGIQDGYYQGKKVKIRTCAISNMPSTASEASNGLTVANSRVSGALYAMAAAAKTDGVNPVTSSGFRSMQLQECLVGGGCGYAGGAVAPAGYSNHQMGLAIDVMDSSFHAWMVKNCENFGYKWYEQVVGPDDPEHFSPTGN